MNTKNSFPELTAEEAAELIGNDSFVGFSGFTPAGAAKCIPRALAQKAQREHDAGRPFKIKALTGASTGKDIDDNLSSADAFSWRAPYQSSSTLRKAINNQEVQFIDMHLSHVGQALEFGFFGDPDFAVVEAVDVSSDGKVYLSTSSGISPNILKHAKKILIERNSYHSPRLAEMHDIAILPTPPHRHPIEIFSTMSRIGQQFVQVNPEKIIGICNNHEADGITPARAQNETSQQIANHIVEFLLNELTAGRIPKDFLPLQAGVGNIANAVLGSLGSHPDIPNFTMFSEVFQDSQLELLKQGSLQSISTTSITLSDDLLLELYRNFDFYTDKVIIRPTEFSNNPGLIRRLGVISINTVLEMDIYGCANSTHVCGSQLMNGIGGSGDFTRNAYLSFLVAPSLAKNGAISAVVPMCSHVDHNEHSVQILVTEQGLADLRGKGPKERANLIIEKCAHPSFRPYLYNYLSSSRTGHLNHNLDKAFELHTNYLNTGHMLPK